MSKKWSSFEKDKLLMESWRSYIAEEPQKVEEAFFGKKEVKQDYPATEVATLVQALSTAWTALSKPGAPPSEKFYDELEALITSQNFMIQEQEEGRLFLGQDLKFDAIKAPTITTLLQTAKANKKISSQLQNIFKNAGFSGMESWTVTPFPVAADITEPTTMTGGITPAKPEFDYTTGVGLEPIEPEPVVEPTTPTDVQGTGQVSTIDTNKNGKPDPGEPEGIDNDGDGVVDKVVDPGTGKTRPYDPAEFDEPTFKGRTGARLVDPEDQRARFHWANQKHRDHQGFYKRIDPEAAAAFKKFVAYLVTPLAEKPKPMPGLVGRQALDALTDTSSMQENYDLVVGAIGDMYTPEQLQQALADMKDEGAMRLILDTLEDEENARSFIAMLKGEKAEKAPKEEEEETELLTRLKTVFGSAMDIASIASFFGPAGQAIGGAATLASMINNLTFSKPKYGWAAVDLAALAVALLPGGTATVKGTALGAKLVSAMRTATTAKKAATAARVARGVHTGAKVTKGAVGAYNIKKELEDGLGEELAAAVTEMLTATAEDGAYYANTVLDEVIGNTARYPEVQKKLLIFKEKMEELQTASAPKTPGQKAFPLSPAKTPGQKAFPFAPKQVYDYLEEEALRWQQLAGIKKEII